MKILSFLLLAALPCTLLAQNTTLVIEYMKVTQESESTYLEVEKAWKKIHQKRIEDGLSVGWQLWRNRYAGYGDEFQYVTIHWYKDWAHSFTPNPEGFYDEFWNGEDAEILAKTLDSRVLVATDVVHEVLSAENNGPVKYIVINHMKVKPGQESEYVKMEEDIFKPLHEEAIKRGYKAHWGVWSFWPFKEGQATYTAVDGFNTVEQLTGGVGEDLLPIVHPDKSWDEVSEKVNETRKLVSAEIWELVDFVFPE
ncbi:MAG: hypothetical protein KAR19_04375 [Bacteroidales bacterium]|nr:hypothetical protein [Bacteroidales bacterium]